MPVKVACPHCTKELNAPDEMLGKVVACPGCQQRFTISGNGGAEPPKQPAASESRSNLFPPSQHRSSDSLPPEPRASSSTATKKTAVFKGLKTPPEETAPPVSDPPLPSQSSLPPRDTGHSSESMEPPVQAPASTTQPKQSFKKSKSTPPAPTAQHPHRQIQRAKERRTAQSAVFVAGEKVASRINLGEDGQLPDLVVHEGKEKKQKDETTQSSNPMIAVAAISFSVLMSVVLLYVPEESSATSSRDSQEIVELIQEEYIGEEPPFEPYQEALRQALLARTQGDTSLERRLYRRVVRMLRSERPGGFGLTGHPDRDRTLEESLVNLLAESGE